MTACSGGGLAAAASGDCSILCPPGIPSLILVRVIVVGKTRTPLSDPYAGQLVNFGPLRTELYKDESRPVLAKRPNPMGRLGRCDWLMVRNSTPAEQVCTVPKITSYLL